MTVLTADWIFPGKGEPLKNGFLEITDDGRIIRLTQERPTADGDEKVQVLHGIICPGLINCHCHLELSHMKGKIPEATGLPGFLKEVVKTRKAEEEDILLAMEDADREMWKNGMIAVGDISNTPASIPVKQQSLIRYHTFVEVFDLSPFRAVEVLKNGLKTERVFREAGLSASVSPHATYSVSEKLMQLLGESFSGREIPLTIHNQETPAEDEMFLKGTGTLLGFLREAAPDYEDWKATGKSALQSWIPRFPSWARTLLVHNTYSSQDDIRRAQSYCSHPWWCFCPNANRFIENKLPDIPAFIKEGASITLGTDSYASNHALSLLEEMKTIQEAWPSVSTWQILEWATGNGATFLGLTHELGSFTHGRRPGINLIQLADNNRPELKGSSLSRLF